MVNAFLIIIAGLDKIVKDKIPGKKDWVTFGPLALVGFICYYIDCHEVLKSMIFV
ncbi:MAG: hypothetical protein AAB932_04570 [Patescibacteria group bacterium]